MKLDELVKIFNKKANKEALRKIVHDEGEDCMPIVGVLTIFEEHLAEPETVAVYGMSKTEIPNEIQDIDDYYEV